MARLKLLIDTDIIIDVLLAQGSQFERNSLRLPLFATERDETFEKLPYVMMYRKVNSGL